VASELQGKKIAFLVAPEGTEQIELRLERHLGRVAEIPQLVDRRRQSGPWAAFPDRAVGGAHPGMTASRSRISREDGVGAGVGNREEVAGVGQ